MFGLTYTQTRPEATQTANCGSIARASEVLLSAAGFAASARRRVARRIVWGAVDFAA